MPKSDQSSLSMNKVTRFIAVFETPEGREYLGSLLWNTKEALEKSLYSDDMVRSVEVTVELKGQ